MLTATQWQEYDSLGYVRIGELLSGDELDALRTRADDFALGRRCNPHVQLQADTGGAYEALPEPRPSLGAGTLRYRKVQGLETDDLFSAVLRQPLIAALAARHYGPHATVSIFRAMVMNKPAGQGTELPWHQDGGDVWALDRDPLMTVWIALDAANAANGCVEVIPGSHRLGLLTAQGSTLDPEESRRVCPSDSVTPLEVEPGHGVLMHNWLVHRSGVNRTGSPRRAFTACLMDGRTRNTLTGRPFPMLFGDAPDVAPYLRQVETDAAALRHSTEESEQYALSLQDENRTLHGSMAAATTYARSLEQEIEALRRQLGERRPTPDTGS